MTNTPTWPTSYCQLLASSKCSPAPICSKIWMFFNTATRFPEGAVLNLRFRLALTGAEIRTRCEVRYCLPGVGVGVEFIGISPEAVRKIEREVQLCKRPRLRRKTVKLA